MVTEIQTSLGPVRFKINPGVSNKHVCTNHPGKIYILRIVTRILTPKHPKLFSMYFKESIGECRNRIFRTPKFIK